MSLEIKVVNVTDKPFFQVEDLVCIDELDASRFEGGQLSVIKGQEIVDRTSRIGLSGTHAETVCYIGLEHMWASNCLFPEEFTVGDRIVIDQLPEERNPRRKLEELLEYYKSAHPEKVDLSQKPPVLRVRYEGYQIDSIRRVY